MPATRLWLEWVTVRNPRLFPSMRAIFALYPRSDTETEIELQGDYEPPADKLGATLDRALLHRIAEAAVGRFVQDVAGWLREDLARPTTARITRIETPVTPVDLEC